MTDKNPVLNSTEDKLEEQKVETFNLTDTLIKDSHLYPSKIIIYNKSGKHTIEKNEKNFNKIIDINNNRIKTNLDVVKTSVSDAEIKDIKEKFGAAEYIYDNNITITWWPKKDNDFCYKFKVKSILIPFGGLCNNCLIFVSDDKFFIVGILQSAEELQKYVLE